MGGIMIVVPTLIYLMVLSLMWKIKKKLYMD